MFIKIEDKKIVSWARWQFNGSRFVDLVYEEFDPEKYVVSDDGNLIDIGETYDYKMKKLDEAKLLKEAENEEAREVEYIKTTFGNLKTQTPIGSLKLIVPNIALVAQLKNGLPEGFLRFYDDELNLLEKRSFTQVEALSLYAEIVEFYNGIDLKSTQIINKIKSAKSQEELDEIEIKY